MTKGRTMRGAALPALWTVAGSAAAVLGLLAGCATPGSAPGDGNGADGGPSAGVSIEQIPASPRLVTQSPGARPGAVPTARCALPAEAMAKPQGLDRARPNPGPANAGAASAGAGSPGSASPGSVDRPLTQEEQRAELLRRQLEANDAFRQRGLLPRETALGAQRCVEKIRQGLNLLRGGRTIDREPAQRLLADREPIARLLQGAGLTQVDVRPPGPYDLGGGDGLLFAGWTGQACIIGAHRAAASTVEVATRTADGGCLPAPG